MTTEFLTREAIAEDRAPTWRRRLLHIWAVARTRAAAWFALEKAAPMPWAAVAIGVGIGVYFGLKTEPHVIVAPAIFVIVAILFMVGRWPLLTGAAALAAVGFIAADFRTSQQDAPVLERPLRIQAIEGRIVTIEDRPDDQRLTIALHSVETLPKEQTPARARVTWRGERYTGNAGDIISVRAKLSPPPPPVAPGAFDFARQLYFQRIGAVGFAVTPPEVLTSGAGSFSRTWRTTIEQRRDALKDRILNAAPTRGGAIVAAVVTGKRDAITLDATNALRDSGLAHLLAISGLHMGLATGLVFFTVRLGLAMAPQIALRYPIKKWAAMAALFSGVFYLILSGGGWSARRAFIMAGVMFIAILFDRRALSMRNVAIAAIIILLTTPEALFQPGFQMSFAAVAALIAIYELWRERSAPERDIGWGGRIRRYGVGLAATDTIAATATAPFGLYHFHRAAIYSLPANLIAMPVMGFWVAPTAIVALCLSPLGLDGWAWRLSASGMEFIVSVGESVSGMPGAVAMTPQWPGSAIILMAVGGLFFLISRAPWRIAGVGLVAISAVIAATAPSPFLFVSPTGKNAMILRPGETIPYAYFPNREKFALGRWRELLGLTAIESREKALPEIATCDARGCIVTLSTPSNETLLVSLLEDPLALREDCARADVIVAFFPVDGWDWKRCEATLIDRRSAWRRGAHAVYFAGNGVNVRSSRSTRGDRPWTTY